MSIALSCSCGKQLKLKDELAGKKVKCPGCQKVLSVPAAEPQGEFGLSAPDAPQAPPDFAGGRFDFSGLADGAPVAKTPAPGAPVKPPYPGQPAEFQPGKGPSKGLPKPVLLAAAGALLLLVVGAGAWWMLRSSFDPYRYMPDGTVWAVAVDFDAVRESDLYKKFTSDADTAKGIAEVTKEAGFGPADIRSLHAGGRIGGDPVVVIRFNRAFTPESLFAGKKTKETKVDSYIIHESPEIAGAYCLVGDEVLIFGKNAAALQKVLQRKGRPDFADGFRKALDEMESKRAVSVALDVKAGSKGKPLPPMFPAAAKSIEAAVLGADLTADLTLSVRLFCSDDKNADELRKMAEGLLASQKGEVDAELKKIFDTVKITASGSVVSGEAVIAGSTINGVAKNPLAMLGLMSAMSSLSGGEKETRVPEAIEDPQPPVTVDPDEPKTKTETKTKTVPKPPAVGSDRLWGYDGTDGDTSRSVLAAALTADGTRMVTFAHSASAAPEGEFVVWSMENGSRFKSWKDDFKTLSMAFSPDRTLVAAVGKGGAMTKPGVRFYSVADGTDQGTYEFVDADASGRVEYDPAGLFVYVAGKSLRRVFRATGQIYDVRAGQATATSVKGTTAVLLNGKLLRYGTPHPAPNEMPVDQELPMNAAVVDVLVSPSGLNVVATFTHEGKSHFRAYGPNFQVLPSEVPEAQPGLKMSKSGRFVSGSFAGGVWIMDLGRPELKKYASVGAVPLGFTTDERLMVRTQSGAVRFLHPTKATELPAGSPAPALPAVERPF